MNYSDIRPAFLQTLRSTMLAVGVAAASVVGMSTSAKASVLPGVTDDYSGTYAINNAFPTPGHGVWLPSFRSGASVEWDVVGGTATYDSTAGTLNIVGQVRNHGDDRLRLNFNWLLNENTTHAGPPACGRPACSSPTPDMVANMKYFDFVGQTLTGAGPILSGLTIDLSIKPSDGSKPPQFGYGGNWRDLEFGYSNWFYWSVSEKEKYAYGLKYKNGRGDMNLTMSTVPLPAAAWMLLAGVGAIGAMGRRKKKAS